MADDAPKPKTRAKVEPSKWAAAKPQADPVIERRNRLWNAINEFVRESGAWIVSPPGSIDLRIEIPERSVLPSRLIELGYQPLHVGSGTRLMPNATTETATAHSTGAPIIRRHPGWLPVDVIEIKIP
jgi:hypothetical protein